ncbi:MAG: glycosyltransferase family A protein [Actinomycetota bacterium]|jgi:glycosyltransferase involved in cell wall biosynthesis|nr:glycosyltransferase family A protein [Actinomycetota bacterium]
MSESVPRVSVAMAAYNERQYLRGAVESILAQSFADFELLIVDDGSTDDCLATIGDLDDPRIVVHRQPNQGKAVALNHVLDHARGEFICLQDADDLAGPERLATQVAALDAHPEAAASFCRHELIVDGRHVAPRYRGADVDECARLIARGVNPGMDPTIMFHRERTAHIRFDPELRIGHGEDHLLRIGEEFPVLVVDGCHYSYRIHSGNMSKGKGDDILRYHHIVRGRAAERRGDETNFGPGDKRMLRPEPMAGVTGYVTASNVELVALGRRGEALRVGVRHLKGIWRYPNSWLPLAYALLPSFVLERKRPDFALIRAARGRLLP